MALLAEERALERHCSVDPGGHEKLDLLNDTGLPASNMTVRLCRAKFQDASSHGLKPAVGKHRQHVIRRSRVIWHH
jgi:hypothetical protein